MVERKTERHKEDKKSKSVRSFAALEMLLLGSGEGKTFSRAREREGKRKRREVVTTTTTTITTSKGPSYIMTPGRKQSNPGKAVD